MFCNIRNCPGVAQFRCICSANILFCVNHISSHYAVCTGRISQTEKKSTFINELNELRETAARNLKNLESAYSMLLNTMQESIKNTISLIIFINKHIRDAKKLEDFSRISFIKEQIVWAESIINYKVNQFNSFINVLFEYESAYANEKRQSNTQNLNQNKQRSQDKLDEIYLKYDIDLRNYSDLIKIIVTNDQAYIFVCIANIGIY